MGSLFDGQGVEWSDLASLRSLQNQQRQIESQRKILEQLKKTEEKKDAGPACPACGFALPTDAAKKRYSKCGHCQSDLSWSDAAVGQVAVPQVAKAAAVPPPTARVPAPKVRKPKYALLQCPHCGSDLPEDAQAKRYGRCRHCTGELHWTHGKVFVSAKAREAFVKRKDKGRFHPPSKGAGSGTEASQPVICHPQEPCETSSGIQGVNNVPPTGSTLGLTSGGEYSGRSSESATAPVVMTAKAEAVKAVCQQFEDVMLGVVGRVIDRLGDNNIKHVFGPALTQLLGRGSPKAIVTFAVYADVLRMAWDVLMADGTVTDEEVQASLGLLSALAAGFARVRREYAAFATLSAEMCRDFLKQYGSDEGPFGHANEVTKWTGVVLCRNVRDICGDSVPLDMIGRALVGWAETIAASDTVSDNERRVVEAMRQLVS